MQRLEIQVFREGALQDDARHAWVDVQRLDSRQQLTLRHLIWIGAFLEGDAYFQAGALLVADVQRGRVDSANVDGDELLRPAELLQDGNLPGDLGAKGLCLGSTVDQLVGHP